MATEALIDAAAREPHFLDHIAPVWLALDPSERGDLWVAPTLVARARRLGISGVRVGDPPSSDRTTLVSSWGDLRVARRAGRPIILMEHGAGQSYVGTKSNSYVGSVDREGVVAVLLPNQRAAARHLTVHPEIPAHVVGCPKMDRWVRAPRKLFDPDEPTIAVSHHWNGQAVAPEARSAYRHHQVTYKALAFAFPGALGHAHPRTLAVQPGRTLSPESERIGARLASVGFDVQPEFDTILTHADCYIIDNSSTMFEFAATDRPVVVLNAPWYRRDVNHGGRFWDWADVGVQVDDPSDLIDAVRFALTDPPEIATRRRRIVDEVYANPGHAAQSAAAAIRASVPSLVAA